LGGSTLGPWLKRALLRERVGVRPLRSKEQIMGCRRLVGIDLGIASAHAVRVLDEEGNTVVKHKAVPTVESLSAIESSALEGTPPGTRLEVVIEPTGPAWLPIAVFFINGGHVVYRVKSTQSADLRRFLSRHAKTNGIDADTLARLPLFHPAGVKPLELPNAEVASLDRRVRAAHRLTRQAALHKTRIKALVRQVMPMSPLGGKLTHADVAVLERWADPNVLVRRAASASPR
jgi:transposase